MVYVLVGLPSVPASGLREKAEILEDERVEKTAAPGGAGEKSKHPPQLYTVGVTAGSYDLLRRNLQTRKRQLDSLGSRH